MFLKGLMLPALARISETSVFAIQHGLIFLRNLESLTVIL